MKTTPLILGLMLAISPLAARAQQPATEAEAQQLLADAVKLLDAGKLRESEEKLQRVIQLAPNAPNPHRLLGIVQFRLALCADAVKEFDEFLQRVGPNDRRATEVISMRDRCKEELAPKVGRLLVDSTPHGADVRIDDEKSASVGKTPVEVKAVPAGSHVVYVELPGFRPASRGFNLGKNETLRLEFGLQKDADALVSAKTVPPSKPVYKKGWFWGVLVTSVAVVGGAVATGVVLGTRGPSFNPTLPEFNLGLTVR
jgi:hypothetical protein